MIKNIDLKYNAIVIKKEVGMKKILMLMMMMGLLMFGVNAFAAGDLVVGGNAVMSSATVSGNSIINGNLLISSSTNTNAPVTRLEVADYQFVTFGQKGFFLKNNAILNITSATYRCGSGLVGPVCPAYGSARNVNGVIQTRAQFSSCDSGWVVGYSASCANYTTIVVTTSETGLSMLCGVDVCGSATWSY